MDRQVGLGSCLSSNQGKVERTMAAKSIPGFSQRGTGDRRAGDNYSYAYFPII